MILRSDCSTLCLHSEAEVEHSEVGHARLKQAITLEKIAYTYRTENGDRPFSVGRCDLKISADEIVFIVSGNGSGKSTLTKILTGLYEPNGGHVY